MAPIYWIIICIVLLIIEIATLGLTTIWFAGGALAAFFAALFGLSVQVQLVLFLAVFLIGPVYTVVEVGILTAAGRKQMWRV